MQPRSGTRSTFDLFDPLQAPGALAGLRTSLMHLLSTAIRNSKQSRHEIAFRMSRLLGEDVSKTMLDAYSAESRLDQNIPAYRFLAFIAATESFAELNDLLRPLGCALLVGEQAKLASIAQLEVERAALDQRIRTLRKTVRHG